MATPNDKLLRPYNPNETEDRIYRLWNESGFFNPDVCAEKGVTAKDAAPFSIVLPPPNVTGTLHMGSAFMLAIEDIIVRYKRMSGKRTLWLPGTDHAAIATQAKVEKIIEKESLRRQEMGRDKFIKRVEKFAEESRETIVKQIKKIGCSVDWSREAFTLDEKRSLAVRTAFKKMYDDGLIFRGYKIVNWDPKGQTVISDDEIIYKEEKTKFYYFKYGPFTISTARPETKFGDKYVVMHPADKRYSDYKHGQKIDLEWINGPITATVIKDESIDMEFGTGVMTITPWHSIADFEIANRHNLDKEQIIDKYSRLLPIAGEFAEMKITEARGKIIEKLKNKGLLVKEEDYAHNIATAERTGGLIEPQIMNQWFVSVNKKFINRSEQLKGIKKGQKVTLKTLMKTAVESGQIEIIPDRFSKVYYHWIDNLHDWCVSRQIWYGHRIPVWYCAEDKSGTKTNDRCKEPIVSVTEVEKCPHCKGKATRDEDTLDTWFSAGLWTFSTLGWPEKTADLKIYHPTTLLETGYDIIFFWVARMILMSTALMGEIPFKMVYLHGLVRNKEGLKVSKSLGNNIDPADMIEKYGADAVRMSLIVGTGPGSDSKMSEDKIRAYKHFANKIWNAARFVISQAENFDEKPRPVLEKNELKTLDELARLSAEITDDMENYRLHLVAEKLYHYFWHTFADIIIEDAKPKLSGFSESAESVRWTLEKILATNLKMLHPFMPFITEEIWSILPRQSKNLLMANTWPAE